MQLGRYNVSTLRPAVINSARPSITGSHFALSTEAGYEVWQTYPLALLRRQALPGTLGLAVLVPYTPLIVLQGGGNNPVYPPNKAVIYHDKLGRPIAELEFGERIRGIVVRRGVICVALSRRVVAFTFESGSAGSSRKGKQPERDFRLTRLGEWETAFNELGLMAISTLPQSTLLALPGRQPGHVQLISLPPCPPITEGAVRMATYRSPIILAHTHPLSSLSCTPDGGQITTTSERGTIIRIWDTSRGNLLCELRRGVDRAQMWGTSFEPDPTVKGKGNIVGWSDKGTIHIWSCDQVKEKQSTITGLLSKNLPLPKYFSSMASFAQYRLPRKNPHAFQAVVGAAAGKAGVPSAKLDQIEEEWAERFIVIWIPVHVDVNEETRPNLGTREERKSFGSDATSRTATPTLRSTQGYPLNRRRKSLRNTTFTQSPETKQTKLEWQLVAITFSGDWYRLRIPLAAEEDVKKNCELVEYRRLGVGGGGW